MSKRNYTQYSKKNENNEVDEATVLNTEPEIVVAPDAVEAAPEVKMEPEVKPEAPKPKTTTGVVANCTKLNVRSKPKVTADVVSVLDAATKVEIDVEKSNKEWYKVSTASGIDGYCMRKFINTNL